MRFVGYFAIEEVFHPQKTAIFWAFFRSEAQNRAFCGKIMLTGRGFVAEWPIQTGAGRLP
jgi:hypothetical protein